MSYANLNLAQPGAGAFKGMIRCHRPATAAYSIPNNVAPYTAHTFPMSQIVHRTSELWTLNASGEIVIPEGVSIISATAQVYWGSSVPATQYTIAIKRFGVSPEDHFGQEYCYDGTAVCISAAGIVEVVPGGRIAIGLRQGTGSARTPSHGFISVAALG